MLMEEEKSRAANVWLGTACARKSHSPAPSLSMNTEKQSILHNTSGIISHAEFGPSFRTTDACGLDVALDKGEDDLCKQPARPTYAKKQSANDVEQAPRKQPRSCSGRIKATFIVAQCVNMRLAALWLYVKR